MLNSPAQIQKIVAVAAKTRLATVRDGFFWIFVVPLWAWMAFLAIDAAPWLLAVAMATAAFLWAVLPTGLAKSVTPGRGWARPAPGRAYYQPQSYPRYTSPTHQVPTAPPRLQAV